LKYIYYVGRDKAWMKEKWEKKEGEKKGKRIRN
jgi:hypothetical protein